MAQQFPSLSPELQDFIQNQKIFFVGTAMAEGRVNISPKGMDALRILDENRLVWLNLTGSGNETAAHILGNNRMTIMFCAFEGKPLILRLYGKAKIYHERDNKFKQYINLFSSTLGARQIVEMEIDLVQTSCGYGVPLMDYKEDRTILQTWAEKKGKEGIQNYWKEKNTLSIDGFPTDIIK